jgi:hypothetical protein
MWDPHVSIFHRQNSITTPETFYCQLLVPHLIRNRPLSLPYNVKQEEWCGILVQTGLHPKHSSNIGSKFCSVNSRASAAQVTWHSAGKFRKKHLNVEMSNEPSHVSKKLNSACLQRPLFNKRLLLTRCGYQKPELD